MVIHSKKIKTIPSIFPVWRRHSWQIQIGMEVYIYKNRLRMEIYTNYQKNPTDKNGASSFSQCTLTLGWCNWWNTLLSWDMYRFFTPVTRGSVPDNLRVWCSNETQRSSWLIRLHTRGNRWLTGKILSFDWDLVMSENHFLDRWLTWSVIILNSYVILYYIILHSQK